MTSPAQTLRETMQAAVGEVVYGMDNVVQGLCLAIINQGHVLIQGVPGLGKTLVAKTVANVLGGTFKRIQCTADLMPSDMTGIHIFKADTHHFEFVAGPLFADVVLVDEINRTGPKTQSALLQAMEEGAVTIDRSTYPLPTNFFVVATQNPREFEGTYPLPESQLDRFLLRIDIGYPTRDIEEAVLRAYSMPKSGHAHAATPQAVNAGLLDDARRQTASVFVSDGVYRYVTALAAASREHRYVSLGLSTRGALALMKCARARAAMRGSDFVTPDDVQEVVPAVVQHRLILTPDAALEGTDTRSVMGEILSQVDVPRE